MQISNNKIHSVRLYFRQKLSDYYPINEIDHFFGILLESQLGYSRLDEMKNPELRMTESDLLIFFSFIRRLIGYEPIQYIVGETEFLGHKFKVNPSVLIPRPETEALVLWIVSFYRRKSIHVIDIGTGSGCIAISLKLALNSAKVTAVDIMADALELAKENMICNDTEISFIQKDALHLPAELEQYDVVVSNPPYVLNGQKKEMRKNVLDFEPHVALFVSDAHPLVFYISIAQWAWRSLKPNGRIFFEINENFAPQILQILADIGFSHGVVKPDMYDKNRMVSACKLGGAYRC